MGVLMTDTDRTNAYSYRGKNDTKHWEKPMLRAKGEMEEEMSEQEKAIFEIENHIWQSWEHGYPIQMTDKSTDVIIEALQKQTPMKPVDTDETYDNYGETFYEYTCPLCEAYIEVSGIMGYQPNYCENCGQKLDWED